MIILFDLSGVLIELGGMSDFIRWTKLRKEEIISRWLYSKSVRNFERGLINFEEFHLGFLKEWNISIEQQELFNAFESWAKEPMMGAFPLLDDLLGKYPMACLSNTNSVQWPIVRQTVRANKYFERQFTSHQIGKIKPDSDIYQYVIGELGIIAQEIFFLDDSELNVSAAQKEGINAVKVNGPRDARMALEQWGFLNTACT